MTTHPIPSVLLSARLAAARPAGPRFAAPRFIAIASGKGGVGKTWFAVSLSHALARQGRRVLLVDGDFGLANVDVQLGLVPMHDLCDVLAGAVGLSEAVRRVEAGGFDVLPGRSGSGALAGLGPSGLDRVLALIALHGAGYDHVVIDLGAGLEDGVRRVAGWAELLLVVATDDPSSVTDAYATLKLHRADCPGGDARLVVNQTASATAARRTADAISRACTRFLGQGTPLLGAVRRDPRVPDAIRHHALIATRHPNSPAAIDVERIAAAL